MAPAKTTTKNVTLLSLKGTPFKNAAERKACEERILSEEWQNIERARVRRELLMLQKNRDILMPLTSGFKARFVTSEGETGNLVRVFLTHEGTVQVDVDHHMKGQDTHASIEVLIRPLLSGVMSGYLAVLGLAGESQASRAFEKIDSSL